MERVASHGYVVLGSWPLVTGEGFCGIDFSPEAHLENIEYVTHVFLLLKFILNNNIITCDILIEQNVINALYQFTVKGCQFLCSIANNCIVHCKDQRNVHFKQTLIG